MSVGPMEILLIVFVILLLFGAAKLPDLARSVGRSARIFKSEVNAMKTDDAADQPAAHPEQPVQQPQLTQGPGSPAQQAQSNAPQSFWNQPENQPRTNPNA